MRTRLVAFVVLLGLASFPGAVTACQFDTDCQVGSTCMKPSGSLAGWCVGGLSPGNRNDQRPARDPTDVTGKRGGTCQFDVDCGPGGQCVKGSGIYGTCF
jgi:hypothetical protein